MRQLHRVLIHRLDVADMTHDEDEPVSVQARIGVDPDEVASLASAMAGRSLYVVAYFGEMAGDVQLAERGDTHKDPESGECRQP